MSQPEYLDPEDLLGLVRRLGAGPVRDVGLLDSAAAFDLVMAVAQGDLDVPEIAEPLGRSPQS